MDHQTFAQILGSYGEFLSSIAVLVTLVILVIQVRNARTEISSQMSREFKRHNNDAFYQLTQNAELLDVHIQGQRGFENLTDSEKVRWQFWLFTWITQTEDGFLARRAGIPNMDWVDAYITGIALALRSNGVREVWPRLTGFFDSDFVDAIDREIASDSTTHLQLMLD